MNIANKLKHLDEFSKILANYQMSETSKRILKKTNLVLLIAPTSTGRNTIIRALLQTGNYHFIVSDTTRLPRVNDGVVEKNGVNYWFRSEEEMLSDLKSGKFLEAAIIHNQQVSGISIRELEKASANDKIAITDIEVVGTENIMRVHADTHAIFVMPPNFEEWLRRLEHRGAMTAQEKRLRLESACKEFMAALEHAYYSFVINDELSDAVEQINQLARLGATDTARQARGRELAQQFLIETKAYLEQL